MKRRWLDKRNEVKHLRDQLYGDGVSKSAVEDFAPPQIGPEDADLDLDTRQAPR
jgi:hypothetical protein